MADVLVAFNKQVAYTGGGSESDECSSSFDECSSPYPRCTLQQSPVLSTSTFFSTMATGLEKAGSDRSDDEQLEGDSDGTTRASSKRTSASPEDADWYRTRTPSPDFCHRFHGHSPDHAHAALSGLLRCTQSEASAPPSPHNMDVPYGCSPKGGVVMNPFAMPASSTLPQHAVASDWGISCSNALFQDRPQHRVLDPCRQMDQHPSVHYQAPTKHLEPEHQSPPQRSHSSQQRQPHPMLVQLTHVDSGEQSCWQLSEQSWRQLQAQFPQALGLPAMPAAGSPQLQQVLVRLPSQVDQYQRPSQEQQGQHQRQHSMPLVVVHPRRQQGQSQQPWQQWQQPGRDEQSKQRLQAGQQQGQPQGQRHQMQHPGQQQSQTQPQVLDPPAMPQQRRKGSHQPSTQGRHPRRAQMPAEAGLQEVQQQQQQQQQQDKVVLDDGIEAVPPPPQPVTQAASIGSLGHPDLCSAPCKFFASRAGCKDSANCDRCHLCSWKKSVHGKKRKPCSSDANRAAVAGKG